MQHPVQQCTLGWQRACRDIFPILALMQRLKGGVLALNGTLAGVVNQLAELGRILPKLVMICPSSATI